MSVLITKVIMPILIPLIQKLLKDNYKLWGDKFFDLIEDAIEDSETTLDDALLPVIKTVRILMGIPDLPDVEMIEMVQPYVEKVEVVSTLESTRDSLENIPVP